MEAVVAGARSATARTPHRGEEAEDSVGASAAGASIAWGAAEGLPWADVTAAEDMVAG